MRPNRIAFVILCLLLVGCHKRPTFSPPGGSAPPPPPPVANAAPSPLEDADMALATRKYDEAARIYREYLASPTATQPARAWFSLGLSYALRPDSDWQNATSALNRVVNDFSDSPLKGPASLILELHSRNLDLSSKNLDLNSKNLELNSKNTDLNSKVVDLNSKNLELHSELDQMTTDGKQREQRIKELQTQLDRLKRIDADRRKRP